MFENLLESHRALVTAAVFLGTFSLLITIGRLLKRRAGVRLGFLFRCFSFVVAFYAALWTWGLESSFRDHVGAAVVLSSTFVVVALLNRFLWDYYFERVRGTPIPSFLREIVALVLFLVVLLLVLSLGYKADAELKGLLAGSGVVAIIFALAAQNMLGGIIAGMSLQISKPYKVGDWLRIEETHAEVMEINWRSTRLRTKDGIYLDVPNNEIVKTTIINLHYPTPVHSMRLRVGVDYNQPPNRVKDVILRAARRVEDILPEPPTKVFLVDFADFAMIYEVKYAIAGHARSNEITDELRTNIWYAFRRNNIRIPFPIRTVQVERRGETAERGHREKARDVLTEDALFQALGEENLHNLLQDSVLKKYGRGEPIIEENAEGSSMFVMINGSASVSVRREGNVIRVGVLQSGDCFGEMSLLTGQPRMATVRAAEDCEVLEISKPVMAKILHEAPECATQLSDLLARRKLETEGIVLEAMPVAERASRTREYSANFLRLVKGVLRAVTAELATTAKSTSARPRVRGTVLPRASRKCLPGSAEALSCSNGCAPGCRSLRGSGRSG